MKPAFTVTMPSGTVDSTRLAGASLQVDVAVELHLDEVSSARVRFTPSAGAAPPAPGDPFEVALGRDGGAATVFGGIVDSVREDLHGVTVQAHSRLLALARGRINKLYEKQKAGDIARDLAGAAGLDIARVDDGIELPLYALSDCESMLEHLLALGRQNGFDCYADSDDKLVFGASPSGGGRVMHTVSYGVDVLAADLRRRDPWLTGV